MAPQYPTRNDLRLCSWRDPWGEAKAWVEKQRIKKEHKNVLVIGLGCGFHIQALSVQHSQLNIFVTDPLFDTEAAFHSFCTSKKVTLVRAFELRELLPKVDLVLKFSPALQGCNESATLLYHHSVMGLADCAPKTQHSRAQLDSVLEELVK
jgi:hypothetical protein